MTRGWKGNELGLQRWEVMSAHQVRLDATEAVAHLMRQGKSFPDAKAEIERRVRAIYKFSRPELYEGYIRMAQDVRFSDMPDDITKKIEDWFLESIEKERGYKAGRIERFWYRLTGLVW